MAQTIVNESKLRAIFTGLSTVFNNALMSTPSDYASTSMMVQSNGRGQDYTWLTRFPKMRQWVGDKNIKVLELDTYYVANKDWESTIAVRRNDIEDDQLGIYNTQAQMLGLDAARLYSNIIDQLKNNGFTDNGIDGVPFYGTHSIVDSDNVSRSYNNRITQPLSAADFDEAEASLGAARVAIMSMRDSEGDPLGLVPDILEVPPALEATARLLATAPTLRDQSPNPYQGTVRVIMNPGITDDARWFLHVGNMPIKPFILQQRSEPKFVSQTTMDAESVFNRSEFRYGVEARCAGAYGFWQLSAGYTP